MRFAYDPAAYFASRASASAPVPQARFSARHWRIWDRRTARQPDLLVANSETVRQRIREHWGRDAEVIHPPVSVSEFEVSTRDDGFLLIAARLLGYRRIDVAVRAATAARRQLVIVGDGPERERLESLAGPTVRLTGWLPRAELIDLFARCHAYVVPGEEDFGIAPVEAMAAGKPVVALARGGVAETVVDGVTGVLFDEQSPAALEQALERLDSLALDPHGHPRPSRAIRSRPFLRRVARPVRPPGSGSQPVPDRQLMQCRAERLREDWRCSAC